MRLPGFSAETSLYKTTGSYRMTWSPVNTTEAPQFTFSSSDYLDSAYRSLGVISRYFSDVVRLDRFRPTAFFCGALGQTCCRAPVQNVAAYGPLVSCQTGLGCDITTNTCVAACGNPGQVCCDGPETRAPKWTASGSVYSPNSWNMQEMCRQGACDRQSHRCFACGTVDGAACCPPDAAQATARCFGEYLECQFNPWGFYDSGTCRACGKQGKPPCRWGCDPGLELRNGLCDLCGADWQPPCDSGCKPGLGVAKGLCRYCGYIGQIPCDSGCVGGLRLKNGLCAACGSSGQPPCDSGCDPGTRLINGVCTLCGNNGQPPCTNGCVPPMKVANGVCRFCGASGQIPCDSGCNPGLTVSGGKCAPGGPPPPNPPTTCATEGQSCVADFVAGTHCCQNAGPLLCVYGKCKACVLHGEECKAWGSQICCSAKDGDQCVLDQFSGKVVCGIPG